MTLPPPESCAAVPVLPDPAPRRHVPSQQQQPVPGIRQEPAAGVPQERPGGFSLHRRPHAVPLHQGLSTWREFKVAHAVLCVMSIVLHLQMNAF